MSRHRFVRDLDLDAERDDGALSDGGDDITQEQQEKLDEGLERVRAIWGTEAQSGLTDTLIINTLWDKDFDIAASLDWLAGEQERMKAARDRKGPGGYSEDEYYDPQAHTGISGAEFHASQQAYLLQRSGGPLIHQVQPEGAESYDDFDIPETRLSTISEHTEQTEASLRRYSPGKGFTGYRSIRGSMATTTTSSYGQVVEHMPSYYDDDEGSDTTAESPPIDPNTIQPSPPRSALRLSRDTSAPFASPYAESSSSTPPRPPSVPLPPLDSIPDIPDQLSRSRSARAPGMQRSNSSKSQHAVAVQVFRTTKTPSPPLPIVDKPLPDLPPPSEPRHSIAESIPVTTERPRKSKLSMLASSRAASTRASTFTKSSRLSTSTIGGASVLTHPALRPSSTSELSFVGEEGETETASTSHSSIVRRAVQVALDMEELDKLNTGNGNGRTIPPENAKKAPGSSTGEKGDKAVHPSITKTSTSSGATLRGSGKARTPSSAESVDVFATSPKPIPPPKSSPILERPQSKLAKLAQAKAKQGTYAPKPKVPRSPSPTSLLHTTHTEYLTPIANGPTATTAITTSYQSLDHLISPARSALPPSFPPIDHQASMGSTSPPEPKQSKLAMKAKKSHRKHNPSPEVVQTYLPVPVPTIFQPEAGRSRHRKEKRDRSVEKTGRSMDKSSKERRKSRSRSRARASCSDRPLSPSDEKTKSPSQKPRHKHSIPPAPLAPLGPFAFDVPSPDDLVFNARKGTTLARSGTSTPSALPASTIHSRSSLSSTSTSKPAAIKA
ncbi:hypothetical protein OF83DRAFT_1154200 [Amylostereum chailletii]|nr:hypothetical protein OF83DRAFT_1154200 [Amylostereum chailletii]